MEKKLRVPLRTCFRCLEKLMQHRSEFDSLCAGGGILDTNLLDRQYACTGYILDGHPGSPAALPPRPNMDLKGPAGIPVYDRILPHPGDSAGTAEPPQDLYVMEYAGTRILYSRIEEEG